MFVCLFLLFRAIPKAHGSSQARGQTSYRCRPTPQPQQHRIRAASGTYTTAHDNAAGSPTHWARPEGIGPTSSWILIGFVSTVPQLALPSFCMFYSISISWSLRAEKMGITITNDSSRIFLRMLQIIQVMGAMWNFLFWKLPENNAFSFFCSYEKLKWSISWPRRNEIFYFSVFFSTIVSVPMIQLCFSPITLLTLFLLVYYPFPFSMVKGERTHLVFLTPLTPQKKKFFQKKKKKKKKKIRRSGKNTVEVLSSWNTRIKFPANVHGFNFILNLSIWLNKIT